jgi:nucleotide-binding universal stress UspA family protein
MKTRHKEHETGASEVTSHECRERPRVAQIARGQTDLKDPFCARSLGVVSWAALGGGGAWMLDRILLATDLSEDSAAAWDIAIALVQRSGRSKLCVLRILDSPNAYAEIAMDRPGVAQRLYEEDLRSAAEEMKPYAARCRASGVEIRAITLAGIPAESIAKTAKHENADLIVLGMRHAGVIDRLLGKSIVGQVTRSAPCHVLCVKPRRRA